MHLFGSNFYQYLKQSCTTNRKNNRDTKKWLHVPCKQEICSVTNKDQMECMTVLTSEEVLSELISVMKTAQLQDTGSIENDESKG